MVIFSVFHNPESPIVHKQPNVKAVINNLDVGIGSLIISERTLCWKEECDGSDLGFCIEYTNVSVHAITKDPHVYATECIFIIVNGEIPLPNTDIPKVKNPESDEEDSDSETEITTQLLLVPADSNALLPIYNALNQCQLLNPDPEDVMNTDEEDDYNVYEDAEGEDVLNPISVSDLGASGDTEMSHLSSQLHYQSLNTNVSNGKEDQNFDDDQFEDAD